MGVAGRGRAARAEKVFLCCNAVRREAQADQQGTLAKLEQLKAKVKDAPPAK